MATEEIVEDDRGKNRDPIYEAISSWHQAMLNQSGKSPDDYLHNDISFVRSYAHLAPTWEEVFGGAVNYILTESKHRKHPTDNQMNPQQVCKGEIINLLGEYLFDQIYRVANDTSSNGVELQTSINGAASIKNKPPRPENATIDYRDEITTEQAAQILGVSRPHVVKLVKRGEIPVRMVGWFRRLSMKDVLIYRDSARRKAMDAAHRVVKLAELATDCETEEAVDKPAVRRSEG